MTNPNNAVGTNGAFGGRTSVNAFNDVLALVSKGVVSGWACSPSSGMTVQLGGVAGTRDVAVAEDNAGNKTTVNNISGSPIKVTIANASTTDNMIDYIVAYVSNPPSGDKDVADNPSACGIISVRGASANTAPTASAIRSAITADGGTGTLAYYVVLAQISVTAGLTTITNDNISAVDVSGVGSKNIDFTTIVYPDFYYSGAFGGTAGFSQTRTITLPRAVKANERCVITSNSKWCIINASPVDSGATTVNVDICPPITSANGCEFRLTATYYTL